MYVLFRNSLKGLTAGGVLKGGERLSKRLVKEVKATINELWKRGIDASLLSCEIEQIIDERWPNYDAERDWQEIAEQLRLA